MKLRFALILVFFILSIAIFGATRIRGGKETDDYKNVAAILLNGKLHCTGTLIGAKTILTAAHCLYRRENQEKDMLVVFGSNPFQPTRGPYRVASLAYPKDPSSGFFFNPDTKADDIGVVYLEHPLTALTVTRLHHGMPSWQTILEEGRNLVFVGYGYDVIEDQPIGAGIKRDAVWPINKVESRRVDFRVPGRNTCVGDSGGPAYIIVSGGLIQVGITSGGDHSCTYGFETRVDAMLPWLKGRVL